MASMAKLSGSSSAGTTSKKRCGTCRDRKISCDRQFPQCSNCVRSNRSCQGYRLRLSWPRDNDPKRSFVYQPRLSANKCGHTNRQIQHFHMVNSTSWDVQRYHYLNNRRQMVTHMTRCSIPCSLVELATGERLLFQYFQHHISIALSTFSGQPLGETLVRVALSGNSQAGVAVQRSMLALAALYRHGLGFQAEKLKLSAIRALSASIVDGFRVDSAVQHVAASMLLCFFETHAHSESSGQWLSYLCGAINIVTMVSEDEFCSSTDALRHWTRTDGQIPQNITLEPRSKWDKRPLLPQGKDPFPYTRALNPLRLLSEVITVVKPSHNTLTDEDKIQVNELKTEVERTAISGPLVSSLPELERGAVARVNAYNLSTLIYLYRATGNSIIQLLNISALVQTGLEMLTYMHGCERPFPLLILGREARTDEERLQVLDFLSEAETAPLTRDLDCMRLLLHALWTQDDLHAESGLKIDYTESLTILLSSSNIVPPFA